MGSRAENESPIRVSSWQVLRIVLGVLLLTAAGLKLSGRPVSAIPQVGWYATPMVQIAAAEWELVLGIWLLSGAYRIGAWFAALATFLTFAGVSGYLGLHGVATCGCFGSIQASPWWAFGVDVGVVVLLAMFRPDFSRARNFVRNDLYGQAAKVAMVGCAVFGLLAAILTIASWRFGSPEAALARLRGDAITAEPKYLDFGQGELGQTLTAQLTVRNWTDNPVRLIGGTSDCSCITISDFPVTIGPKESRTVSVKLQVKISESGIYTRTAELRTDCDQRQSVAFLAGYRAK